MHIPRQSPYGWGYTPITEDGSDLKGTMMDFGVLRLQEGETYNCELPLERAFLVMAGQMQLAWGDLKQTVERTSLFHQSPICLHVPGGVRVQITAQADSELVIIRTVNEDAFTPVFYSQNDTRSERRGEGTMQETSTRIVRTIFDKTNAPDAKLVLGEVINFPGKWSSYPPHHHAQPEIYHYRFLPENGFGACVIGDDIFKVKHRSTTLILDDKSHPQTAAPGYAMFYVWAIRHLDDDPYVMPTYPIFEDEHTWVMDDDAEIFPQRSEES